MRQLQEIQRHPSEYDSSESILVTSSTCSEKLQEQALGADVKLIDGEALVEWIYDALSLLSAQTKRKLCTVTAPRPS